MFTKCGISLKDSLFIVIAKKNSEKIKEIAVFYLDVLFCMNDIFLISFLRYMCEVQHFKIYRQNDGHFIWESDKFPTLGALVNFYKSSSVSRSHHITLKEIVKEQKVRCYLLHFFRVFNKASLCKELTVRDSG